MTTTIAGSATHTPEQVLGFKSERRARNVFVPLAGAADVSVSLRTAGLRRGTLAALFSTSSAAMAFEAELAGARSFDLASDDQTGLDMTFVLQPDSRIELELEPCTRRLWTVTFDFQEIS
jgi:hypothetical protein